MAYYLPRVIRNLYTQPSTWTVALPMTFRFFFCLLFSLFCSFSKSHAQPKREFRGVWVANVSNIDWPSNKTLSAEEQRAELVELLDMLQKCGFNAIFLQIRNACDAVYESRLEPWSEWLMGHQGLSPNYDPLAFAIRECRKRNIEIHAWINPYRAVVDVAKSSVAENHISKTHPEWILRYANLKLLDPGLPEVRSYVTKVVLDVVRRYDIDGVHFDDYFYPYPQAGFMLDDKRTFEQHDRGFVNRNDWRRDNVDLLVKMVSDSIRQTKPWVKFGVSPFGIWQNNSTSALGSDTKGFESYSGIYADTKKWIDNNWIDYVAPQIYWSIGNATADFSTLIPWWNDNMNGQHLYVGHGLYKVNNDADRNWRNRNEIVKQISLARSYDNVKGSVFFSVKTLKNNSLGTTDLINASFEQPALVPQMKWKDGTPPSAPTQFLVKNIESNKVELSWKYSTNISNEFDKARAFVVYRFESGANIDMSKSSAIRTIVPNISNNSSFVFSDAEISTNSTYNYVVTALDRFQNESLPAEAAKSSVVTAIMPQNELKTKEEITTSSDNTLQVFPNPFNQQVSIRFRLDTASDVQLFVYDSNGSRVGVLIDGQHKESGLHSVVFNGEFLSEGTYLARLMAKGVVKTAKIVLTK